MKILIIGRYLKHPIYNVKDYDYICFINCDSKHPKTSKYRCLCSNQLFSKHYPCLVYCPLKKSKIKLRNGDIFANGLKSIIDIFPSFKKVQGPKWPTTGLFAIYYFLRTFEYQVDVLGFSQFNIDKTALIPTKGMIDAYNNTTGKHDVNHEYKLADYLLKTYSNRLNIHKSNFVGDSTLEYFIKNCNPNIFIIGDSHIRIFKNIPIGLNRTHLIERNEATICTVYMDGIDELLNQEISNINSEELPMSGDICLFSFGCGDITRDILKNDESIKTIVQNYVDCIHKYSLDKLIHPIIQVDFIHQQSEAYVESLDNGINLRKEINNELKAYCLSKDISIFEHTKDSEKLSDSLYTQKPLSEDNLNICDRSDEYLAKNIWNEFKEINIKMI